MKIKEILVLHHSHMDIGYTHPQRLVWKLHDRCIDEAIDLCEKTAAYPEGSRVKWTCEVTNVVLHWLKTATPAQIERMQKLVANGQISFGAMLCHWTALHQEDLLIESLQPMKLLRAKLGAKFTAAMQTDVNGVAWPVTDMLLDAGIRQLMMNINIHMGGFPLTRPNLFRWQAPSGREIAVFSGEHYNQFGREIGLKEADISIQRIADGLEGYCERLYKKGWSHDFAILTATHPVMDDNGPPNPELPEVVRRWNDTGRAPFIRIVSLDEMTAHIAALDPVTLPVHSGDWTDFWTNGVAASALDVVMSRRAHGALWSARALATQLPEPARDAGEIEAATEMIHLANEHTWNVYSSTAGLGVANSGRFEPIPEAEQRIHKSEKCAGALSLARMLRRDALDTLAGNPAHSRTQDGLLLFNPGQLPRTVSIEMPGDLAQCAYPLVYGTKHRFDVIEDILANTTATTWLGPVEVPPLTLKTVRIGDLKKTVPITATSPGQIESRFWRLRFHPESGVIQSLVHIESGQEYFDAGAGWDLFGPVQETVAAQSQRSREINDPRYDLFQVTESEFDEKIHFGHGAWARDWKANYARPGKTLRVESATDGEGIHLNRFVEMSGALGQMQLTISLLGHEPRVRFTAYFNKSDEMHPESLYFTFPFKMEAAQAHFDIAGASVAYDREQLPGACRDWFTAGSYVAVEGREGCLTLACPDAPLFQLGAFSYARRRTDAQGINQALLLAWPTNNYWNTNFRASQPGYMRFRYELVHTSAYRPAASARFAATVARPVMFHPVVSVNGNAATQTLVEGLGEEVSVITMKPDGGNAIILGLRNHAGNAVTVSPAFPGRTIAAISRLDTLEESDSPLPTGAPVELPDHRTTLLRVTFVS